MAWMRTWTLTAIYVDDSDLWFIEGKEHEWNDFMEPELLDVDTFGSVHGYNSFEEADAELDRIVTRNPGKFRESDEHLTRVENRRGFEAIMAETEIPMAVQVGRSIFNGMIADGDSLEDAQRFADEWDAMRKGEHY